MDFLDDPVEETAHEPKVEEALAGGAAEKNDISVEKVVEETPLVKWQREHEAKLAVMAQEEAAAIAALKEQGQKEREELLSERQARITATKKRNLESEQKAAEGSGGVWEKAAALVDLSKGEGRDVMRSMLESPATLPAAPH